MYKEPVKGDNRSSLPELKGLQFPSHRHREASLGGTCLFPNWSLSQEYTSAPVLHLDPRASYRGCRGDGELTQHPEQHRRWLGLDLVRQLLSACRAGGCSERGHEEWCLHLFEGHGHRSSE